MLEAENYKEARRLSIIAHTRNFGREIQFPYDDLETEAVQEYYKSHPGLEARDYLNQFTYPNKPNSATTMKTYLVSYKCTGPGQNQTPNHFIYEIPPDPWFLLHLEQRFPVQCEAADCPVKGFHYQGLYMEYGYPMPEAPGIWYSGPPQYVMEAMRRKNWPFLTERPGDRELIARFNKYHAVYDGVILDAEVPKALMWKDDFGGPAVEPRKLLTEEDESGVDNNAK